MEKRFFELQDVECRTENDTLSLSGYAVRFDEESNLIMGQFIEVIDKRAFDGVDLSNVFLLYNHNKDDILGNTRSNTLSLTVTEKGLQFRASLPNTQRAKEVYELVQRGDIRGMSYGFKVAEKGDTWDMRSNPKKRTINQLDKILEITVTPFPAYESTSVDTRTVDFLDDCKQCKDELDEILANPLAVEARKIQTEVNK